MPFHLHEVGVKDLATHSRRVFIPCHVIERHFVAYFRLRTVFLRPNWITIFILKLGLANHLGEYLVEVGAFDLNRLEKSVLRTLQS